MNAGPNLVLFDGECAFCTGWVMFLVHRDHHARLRFAPLQGSTARGILARHGFAEPPLRSMILIEDADTATETLTRKSEAALRTFAKLGGAWRAARWLQVFPRALRDAVYDFIAARRHRLSRSTCELPDTRVRARFLP